MVFRCAVEVCGNSSRTRARDPNVKFYSFPKTTELREKWIQACQKSKTTVAAGKNYAYICSNHFLLEDFERDLKAELLHLPPKRNLKPEAVPSRYLTGEEIKEWKVTQRKERFQECLRTYRDGSNISLCETLISAFGVPKIFVSADEITKEGNIKNITSDNDLLFPVSRNQVESVSSIDAISKECESLILSNPGSNRTAFILNELCRLCGSYSDRMKSITNNSQFDYHRLIQKYLPSVQICGNDFRPQVMCCRCEDFLLSWNQFWEMCDKVNQRFEAIMNLVVAEKTIEPNINLEMPSPNPLLQTQKQIEDVNSDPKNDVCNSSSFIELEANGIEREVSDSDTVCIPSVDLTGGKKNLKKTLPRKRKKRIYGSRPICSTCGKSFICSYTMKIHMRTVHTNDRPFLCNYCSSRFKRRDHLQSHISMVHENSPSKRSARRRSAVKYPPKPFLCSQCGKTFCSKNSYREHVDSIHNGLKKYRCEECNLSFSRYSYMYRHKVILNHSRKNQFLKACDFCGLEFESETYYIRHLMKHEEVERCEKCCEDFKSHQEYTDHVSQVHFQKQKITCDVCRKTFTSKASLLQHRGSHQDNEKPFQCEHCDWKFKNKGHLVVHMYRHTGERPYVCSICSRGFKQKGDMRKHKANHLLNDKKYFSFPREQIHAPRDD